MKKDRVSLLIAKTLKKLSINVDSKTVLLLSQIFKFLIVGGFATLIDFAILYYLRDIINLPIILANTLSFSISLIFNYILSIKSVYNVNEKRDKKKNFIFFIIFSIIGLIINNLILYVLVKLLSLYYMLAKLIATIIVMIFNYVTRKLFLE